MHGADPKYRGRTLCFGDNRVGCLETACTHYQEDETCNLMEPPEAVLMETWRPSTNDLGRTTLVRYVNGEPRDRLWKREAKRPRQWSLWQKHIVEQRLANAKRRDEIAGGVA